MTTGVESMTSAPLINLQRASQICVAHQATDPSVTDEAAPNIESWQDIYDLLSMFKVIVETIGERQDNSEYLTGTINFYRTQLVKIVHPHAFETYTAFMKAQPEWGYANRIEVVIAALVRRLSTQGRNKLNGLEGIDNVPSIANLYQNVSVNALRQLASPEAPNAQKLQKVADWMESAANNSSIINWVNSLTSNIEALKGMAGLSEQDKQLMDNIIFMVEALKAANEASAPFNSYRNDLTGVPEDVQGTYDDYQAFRDQHQMSSAGLITRLTLFQIAQENPEIMAFLGNPASADAISDFGLQKVIELVAAAEQKIKDLCGTLPPPPVCPGDPSCPPEPGILPPPLLNPVAYEGVGQLNWLDNLAVKYHLLPHAQLSAGAQYESLEANQIGLPESTTGNMGGSVGLDWSTGVGEGYTLSLGADGGYQYEGGFGANNEPNFHSGFLTGSVAGLTTNYLPAFELQLKGVFTNNDRSELSPWTSPTGNAFSLNALISQPLYRFGSGVLSLDVPGGLDLGWYEPFGEGSGPLPDESANFMRGNIGAGLRLNLDVPITLFAGYRHIWEMPSRYFMDQAYGYQTYEGNGVYLGLGAQAGLWSGNMMFNYDVMDNWNDQWKLSYFNQFDLGNFAPGFGVSAGQGNFYDIQSTDVNGEVGIYDIDLLHTNYFETTLDVVANGGYSWLDNGSEGYVVGGGVRINFGPSSDPTGVEALYPAGAMLTTDAELSDAYLTAETDEVGATYTDPRVIQMLGVAPSAITAQLVEDYAQMFKVGNLNASYRLTASSLGDDGDCSVAIEDEDNAIAFGDVAPVPANLEPQQYVMIGAARYTVANTQSDAENPVQGSILGTLLAQAALHVTRMIMDNNFYFMGNEEDGNRMPQDLYWMGVGEQKGIRAYLPEGTTREQFMTMLKDELAGGVIGKATLALLRFRLQLQPEQAVTQEYVMKIYSEIQENAPAPVTTAPAAPASVPAVDASVSGSVEIIAPN